VHLSITARANQLMNKSLNQTNKKQKMRGAKGNCTVGQDATNLGSHSLNITLLFVL